MTPARDPKQDNSEFPQNFERKFAETSIFEVLRSCCIDPYRNFLFSSYPDPFRTKSSFSQPFFEGFRRFPKVSEGFWGFPRVSKVFPRVSKGFQWFPKVSKCFRFSILFDFSGPSQMFDGWWLMIDDWWSMTDDWWWMDDGWMIDDWWFTNWQGLRCFRRFPTVSDGLRRFSELVFESFVPPKRWVNHGHLLNYQ